MVTYTVMCTVQHTTDREVVELLHEYHVHVTPYAVVTVVIFAYDVHVEPR